MIAELPQIRQLSLEEAAAEFNSSYGQLRDAVKSKELKHFKRGKVTYTTNFAMTQYLMRLTENMDFAPERQNFDVSQFGNGKRRNFDMKKELAKV